MIPVRPAIAVMWTIAAAFASSLGSAQDAPRGPVIGTCNVSPVVADLDRSLDFYRTVVGLAFGEVSEAGPAPSVFLDIHGITTPEARLRYVVGRIPGERCGVEPLEFRNLERRPIELGPHDPGATTVVLLVRDLMSVRDRMKAAGVAVVSARGEGVRSDAGTAVLIKAPDGHFVEFREAGGHDGTPSAAPDRNIVGWRVRVAIKDTDATLRLYHDRLGFRMQPGRFAQNRSLTAVSGLKDDRVRITTAELPDGPAFEFVEFKGGSGSVRQPRVQDPGATRLQLLTPDARRVAALVKGAGGAVISTRGEVFALGGRSGAAATQVTLVRDFNGIYWEIVQRPPAAR